ncbi:MAG TPA: flagellar basal body-associated FliL family protein [Gaiellaceae bacterium]|jgi:flagellar basal body-associated protein FliL|nr:flagellar basal body-associated FliL family protein [Gaiellaceae bacterium]
MKKKLMILVPLILLIGAGGTYEMVLKPKPKAVVPKLDGTLVSLGDAFTVNLAGGHYGRISVAVLVNPAPALGAGSTAGLLPENDAVRAIVTDDLTGVSSDRLINRAQRHDLLAKILADLKKSTDEPVTKVFFTDVAVQ